MKFLLKTIIIFFVISNISYSTEKIAFVDIDFIINGSELGKRLNKKLNEEIKKEDERLKKKEKDLKSK